MKKEDLRVTKTKRDLRYAIISMLKDNQFDKITVSEICDTAMVNRMTFYKHFQDKYDLLEYTLNYMAEKMLAKTMEEVNPNHLYADMVEFCVALTKKIIEECYEKRTVLKLLSMKDDGMVYNVVVRAINKYIEMLVCEISKVMPVKYPIPAITAFMTGGATHMLHYWVMHTNEYSKEDFIKDSTTFISELMQTNLFFGTK